MAPSNGSGKRHPGKSVLAGGIAGGIEIMIMYPTEYVKTILQLDAGAAGQRVYSGSWHCAKQTMAQHGVAGLYRGMSSLLYGSIPKSAVRFTTFEVLKNAVCDERGHISRGQTLMCGLGAGVAEATLVVTPMEAVKVKLIHDQTQKVPRFASGFRGVLQVCSQEGLAGCYRGLLPTILKQGSNQAIRFFVFNECKSLLQGGDSSVQIGTIETALCGATAGAASVLGNTPIDVVKSRLQGLNSHEYSGAWDCAKRIARDEGVSGFYKGTIPRLGRVCGDVAIVFTLYETVNKALDKVWDTSDY